MGYGDILRACRKRAGLTQEELAHLLHTDQANISRYESGKQEPSISFFQAWVQNTQSPEVMAAFLLGIDALTIVSQVMSTFGGTLGIALGGIF